jgi:hypothetical protein
MKKLGAIPAKVVDLDESLIEKIAAEIPAQPWSQGMHNDVALKLGIPPKVVRKAVTALIQRGKFKLQIDGKLYEAKPDEGPSDGNAVS